MCTNCIWQSEWTFMQTVFTFTSVWNTWGPNHFKDIHKNCWI